jgi:hypothetical protein
MLSLINLIDVIIITSLICAEISSIQRKMLANIMNTWVVVLLMWKVKIPS